LRRVRAHASLRHLNPKFVIPAKAAISCGKGATDNRQIPAFAGMTEAVARLSVTAEMSFAIQMTVIGCEHVRHDGSPCDIEIEQRTFPGEGRGPVGKRWKTDVARCYFHYSSWTPAFAGEGICFSLV
jgi:hypothetical protein